MVKKVKAAREKKPTDKLADKTALTKFLQGVFGDAQKKTLKRLWKRAQEINKLEPKYEKMSDEELAEQTEEFKRKIDKALKVYPSIVISGSQLYSSAVIGSLWKTYFSSSLFFSVM